jgi:hypothetical protein
LRNATRALRLQKATFMKATAKGWMLVLVALGCGVGCADVDDDFADEEIVSSEEELKAQPTADPATVIANLKPSSSQSVIAQFSLPADQINALECDWAAKRIRLKVKLGKVTKSRIKVKSVRIEYVSSIVPANLTVFGGDTSWGHGIDEFGQQGFVRRAGTSEDIAVNVSLPVQGNGEGAFVFFNFLDDDGGLGGKPGDGLICGRIAKLAFRVR